MQSNRFRSPYTFFQILVARQIRQDYLENITGFAWLILQPLLLLGVYAFVFTNIFSARLPADSSVGFVPYLAVAFWPWTAFSESIIRATNSITGNAGLISKVSFATELLPLSSVTAVFLMHATGYLAVLLILQFTGTSIHWLLLPLALALLALMWLLACAITLFTSALQVFVKDVAQILPPLMTFWFFTTPIVYSPEVFPEQLTWVMEWNLVAWFVGRLRDSLLFGAVHPGLTWALLPVLVAVLLWLGLRFFRRLSGHFEDFL